LFQTLQWSSWSLGLAVLVTVYHQAAIGGGSVTDSLARGTSSAFVGATVIAGLTLISTLVFVRSAIQPPATAAPPEDAARTLSLSCDS
jgi:hypothetical protein